MDHKLIESLQWADKYTLNDLSAAERTQFEEHLFDCPICSEQVRQTFTVIENLNEVLREERATSSARATKAGWREWFRLPSLVPALAALCLAGVVVYQNAGSGQADMAQVLTPSSFVAPVSRGDKTVVHVNRKSAMFLLSFNVDGAKPDSLAFNFKDAAGKPVLTVKTEPQSTASFTLPILLPVKNFPAGEYRMLLHPLSEPDSITTYPFVVTDDTK